MRLLSLILFFICLGLSLEIAAQGASNENVVKWTAFSGKDNEFVVYFPSGYLQGGKLDIQLGGDYAAPKINAMNKIGRAFNDTLLLISYYDGEAAKLQERLALYEGLKALGEKRDGSFLLTDYQRPNVTYGNRLQFLLTGKRLYIIEAYYRPNDDKLANAFFASVRLKNEGKTTSPNAPVGATKTVLPKLVEREIVRDPDDQVFAGKPDWDVREIERPFASIESNPLRGRYSYVLTLDVTYGASGKIADVKIVKGLEMYQNEVMRALKKTIFIPAFKDGKYVSVTRRIAYSGSTSR